MSQAPRTLADVRAAVERELPGVLERLAEHVAIESVSADPTRDAQVERSAAFVAEQLQDIGAEQVRVTSVDGGKPAVIGHFPAPPGQPTVCLYAHHDVQPEGDPQLWQTDDPFRATQIGDRLFGRGAADDKGGLAMHLVALRAFDGRPPVGVIVFSEGEEEIGSPSLAGLLEQHRDDLSADVFVIGDSGNWAVGVPSLTTTLRGMAEAYVEVRTAEHALHSGTFGGAVPDALTALCRLLATLHDERGDVAVPGITRAPAPELEYPAERIRAESGILDGVQLLGSGSVAEQIWSRPAITVIGLDATPVDQASNTLWPSARATVSLRVAPGQDAAEAQQLLLDHLRQQAPWGAEVQVTGGESGDPSTVPVQGEHAAAARAAFVESWGTGPVQMGQGGSIPMIADFAAAYPEATILVTAVGDPDSRQHGSNESLHLGDFARACLSEALLLHNLQR